MESKFKYLLTPENVYIMDFGDFQAQATGQQIMDQLRRIYLLETLFDDPIEK
jgi:hypothetical protein